MATVCPHCGFGLSAYRKRGQIECRKCGYEISAKQADCPHCGTSSPGSRYPTWVGPSLALVAFVLLAGAAVWTQLDRFRPSGFVAEVGDTVAAEIPAGDLTAPPAMSPVREGRTGPALTQPELNYVTQFRWTSTWVNVRSERSGDTPVVRTLNPGERLQVDSLANGWWRVYIDGQFQGYVANRLLLEEPPFQ